MVETQAIAKRPRQSILNSFTFYSDLSLDEIRRSMADYEVEYNDGNELHFLILEIGMVGQGLYSVELPEEGQTETSYDDTRAFADFLCGILRPYSYTFFDFTSDANIIWGWFVKAGDIPQALDYAATVNGRLLTDVIQELEGAGYK